MFGSPDMKPHRDPSHRSDRAGSQRGLILRLAFAVALARLAIVPSIR
jgi:hypothetical protein